MVIKRGEGGEKVLKFSWHHFEYFQTLSMTYVQRIRDSDHPDFLKTKQDLIRHLDEQRREQNRAISQSTHMIRTVPNRIHNTRVQYYLREERYSRQALDRFCGKCLKDMWDNRKSSMMCVSLAEKIIREETFQLFQKLFDLEYGSKQELCENQKKLKKCGNDLCLNEIIAKSDKDTKVIRDECYKITKNAENLIDKMTRDSDACMKGYIQGFEQSKSSCDDNPVQVDDPNRHESYRNDEHEPENDGKMEM